MKEAKEKRKEGIRFSLLRDAEKSASTRSKSKNIAILRRFKSEKAKSKVKLDTLLAAVYCETPF